MSLGDWVNSILNPLGLDLVKTRTRGHRGPNERSQTPKITVFALNSPDTGVAPRHLPSIAEIQKDRSGHVLLYARHPGFKPDTEAAYYKNSGGMLNVRATVWKPGEYAILMLPRASRDIPAARLLPLLEEYLFAVGSGALGIVYGPVPLDHSDDGTRAKILLVLRRSRLLLLEAEDSTENIRERAGDAPSIVAAGEWDPSHPFAILDSATQFDAYADDLPRISLVTTCKGRLAQLQQAFPTWMSQEDSEYECIIADFDCPEDTTGWVVAQQNEKAIVAKIENRPFFNQSHARNLGARNATGEILVFIDADTLLKPGFIRSVRERLKPGGFLVTTMVLIGETQAGTGKGLQGYGGIMACYKHDWEAIRGFDETLVGWGGEDDDFRRRMIALGRSPGLFDMTLCEAMDHDDASRTEFYEEKQIGKTSYENTQRTKDPTRPIRRDFGMGGSESPVTIHYCRPISKSI